MKKKCYGNFTEQCSADCCYYSSCQYYSSQPKEIRLLGFRSLDALKSECLGTENHVIFQHEVNFLFSMEKLKIFLSKLDAIDKYTLQIIKNRIEEKQTLKELAKEINVARQSIYRKIIRAASRYPWLIPLFETFFVRNKPGGIKLRQIKRRMNS